MEQEVKSFEGYHPREVTKEINEYREENDYFIYSINFFQGKVGGKEDREGHFYVSALVMFVKFPWQEEMSKEKDTDSQSGSTMWD